MERRETSRRLDVINSTTTQEGHELKTRCEIEQHIGGLIEEFTDGRIGAATVQSMHRLITDLNLDSLDYAAVMLSCERWLGIKVREDNVNWAEIQTVGQLAQFLCTQQSP